MHRQQRFVESSAAGPLLGLDAWKDGPGMQLPTKKPYPVQKNTLQKPTEQCSSARDDISWLYLLLFTFSGPFSIEKALHCVDQGKLKRCMFDAQDLTRFPPINLLDCLSLRHLFLVLFEGFVL